MLTIVFTTLFYLLALHSVSKKFARSSCGICEFAKREKLLDHEIELNEVESLSIGWPRDVFRIGMMLLLIMMAAIRFWDFYSQNKWFQWNDNFTDAMTDSFFITVFLNTLPILGWTPWQWGAVTIDAQSLCVPRTRKTAVFRRGPNTRIKVVRGIGGSFYHCAAINDAQSARFYTNARGVARLYAWSLPAKNNSHKNEASTP